MCVKILSSASIYLIQLHYFADVMNDIELIDWEIR